MERQRILAPRPRKPRGDRLLNFVRSRDYFLLALLFASTLALGACLWLGGSELRQGARRAQKLQREAADDVHAQFAALNERLAGELARHRRDAEQVERNLEAAVRRRLEELQALLESLRAIEAKLHARITPAASDANAGTVAKEARGGFSVIARPPKTGGGEGAD